MQKLINGKFFIPIMSLVLLCLIGMIGLDYMLSANLWGTSHKEMLIQITLLVIIWSSLIFLICLWLKFYLLTLTTFIVSNISFYFLTISDLIKSGFFPVRLLVWTITMFLLYEYIVKSLRNRRKKVKHE